MGEPNEPIEACADSRCDVACDVGRVSEQYSLEGSTDIPYNRGVVVEWDEAKCGANLVKHGVDFLDAVEIFADPLRVERIDQRGEYGEERRQVIGQVGPQVLFVAYTLRGEVRRMISARRASRNERQAYHAGGGGA